MEKKNIVLYFANWNIYKDGKRAEVSMLPWDKITCINHAFWAIVPTDGGYKIKPTDSFADLENQGKSLAEEGLLLNHFNQYQEFHKRYPDVNILLSIGGWARCGYFSEMALTKAGRESFINSCVDTLQKHSFFGGIDIDWEYPGCERQAMDDEGCPVVGEDHKNFTLLLKELRSRLDKVWKKERKILTICEGADIKLFEKQQLEEIHEYVDMINIMTYDMGSGTWGVPTMHQSALYSSKNVPSVDHAVTYFLERGVPKEKLNVGIPFYTRGWGNVTPDASGNLIGVTGDSDYAGEFKWHEIKKKEESACPDGEKGFHKGYDEAAKAAYLWNDDESSPYYHDYYSYDNETSITAKVDYVKEKGLGGVLIWESSGDDVEAGYPLINLIERSSR